MIKNIDDKVFASNLIFRSPLKSRDAESKNIVILPEDKEVANIEFMLRLSEAIAKVPLSRNKFLHHNALALDSKKHHFQWPNGKPFVLPEDGLDAYLGQGDGTGSRYVSDLKNYFLKNKKIKQVPQNKILGRLRVHSLYFAVNDYPTYYWIIKGKKDNQIAMSNLSEKEDYTIDRNFNCVKSSF